MGADSVPGVWAVSKRMNANVQFLAKITRELERCYRSVNTVYCYQGTMASTWICLIFVLLVSNVLVVYLSLLILLNFHSSLNTSRQ